MKHVKNVTAATLAAATMLSAVGCNSQSSDVPKIEPEKNADGNYNILFITTDQERYFSTFPEGTDYKARQLLAELGTTFEKHYVCANVSTSSRSVIYTGTHITDTAMLDNIDFDWQAPLDESLVTVGDRMREAGYYTAYKGKWHMGDSSILEGVKPQITDLEGYGFADWGGVDRIGKVWEGFEADPEITSEAVLWLDGKGKQLNAEGKSFFLAVNFVNPHDIMNYDNTGFKSNYLKLGGKPESEVYEKTYADQVPASWNFDANASDVPDALRNYKKNWGMIAGSINEEEAWKDYQDYYYNCIQDNDNSLMELLTYLTDNGMFNNTIVVFTSDHGEMHGSHGLKGKGGFLYENNIHVPLYIVHPDYEGGKRISAITCHMDLAPTFVDMANMSDDEKETIAGDLAGHSLLDLMDGTKTSVREGSLFCFEMLSFTAMQINVDEAGEEEVSFDTSVRGVARGLVTEKYKFVRYFSPVGFNTPTTIEQLLSHNDIQLFDLKNDPEELNNLAADPAKNEALIMDLNAQLNRLIEKEIGIDDGQEMTRVLRGLLVNAN
ncbi:MAG: sulfatase-like hydrolase/transferase [Clostridiaceae bacterium]|jgi:arylsulfatase|nr:sulfatase-like hydrolase/transferase [Clostridia bacterium]MBP6161320.1 sulfatase-like hydrolase/transferase [Clostridia bacterium]MBP6949372.1 sulfatase-like hydrolase/transferase [Clostridia bacterium]NMA35220.1 sulfatase-like hydrolase/transferase [Clostridiaceae bacterium]